MPHYGRCAGKIGKSREAELPISLVRDRCGESIYAPDWIGSPRRVPLAGLGCSEPIDGSYGALFEREVRRAGARPPPIGRGASLS
jgi:hypothetical protein